MKTGRKTHVLTGPQLIWDLENKYGFSAYGVLQPIATFLHGRMDGNYDGDKVFVTLDGKEGPPTFEEYYFPKEKQRICLTVDTPEEEILALLELLGRPT